MHGSASGLIEAFQTYYAGPGSGVTGALDWGRIPAPPAGFFKYGSGGISGLGTICGIPNGACAVLGLVGKGGAGDVLNHYSTTLYPTADLEGYTGQEGNVMPTTPPDPIDDGDVLAHTISNSPICHASISKWCYAAGVNLADKDAQNRVYKNDRCGKVCADLAAFTARLINGQVGSPDPNAPYYSLAPGYTPSEVAQYCTGCHGKKSDASIAPATIGDMQCDTCHTDFAPHEGKKFFLQNLWTEGWDTVLGWVPQNTFAPNDWIRYCMRFQLLAPGALYVRLKPGTSRAEGYDSGGPPWTEPASSYFNKAADCSGTTTWYFPSSGGVQLPSTAITKGRFRAQVEVGDTSSGPLLYVSPMKMVYFDVS